MSVPSFDTRTATTLGCAVFFALFTAGIGSAYGADEARPAPGMKATDSQMMLPPKHPDVGKVSHHPVTGSQMKVVTSPEVVKRWKAVELAVQASNDSERRLNVAVGSDQALVASSGLTLHVIAFLPAFMMQEESVTSASVNPTNPAVLLRLTDAKGKLAEGWVFQKMPEFNTFRSDKVDVKLIKGLSQSR
jgi:hypothetical protein